MRTREELAAYHREWSKKNRDKVAGYRAASKQARREWKQKNKDRLLEYQREYRKKNRDRILALDKAWKERNAEHWKSLRRRHYDRHRFRYYSRSSAYRHRRKEVTPKWANKFFIEEIYALARLRTKYLGVEYHVDHIVPLKSKSVCGLHCEANLRIIPAIENNKKNNKTWPDKPE